MRNLSEIGLEANNPKNGNLNVLYTRVSSLDQKTDRQRVREADHDWIIEDKISGSISFFERPGGKELMKLIDKGLVQKVSFWEINRAGRSQIDILNTVKFFSQKGIQVEFLSQGIKILDEDGKETTIGKIFVSLLGSLSEINRLQIKEAQAQGIELAKARGVYKGRKRDTIETTADFLGKKRNVKALNLLKKGYKGKEVASILGMSPTTISKIKKLGMSTTTAA